MTEKGKYIVTVFLSGTILLLWSNFTQGSPINTSVTDFLPKDQGTVAIDNLTMQEFRKGRSVHEIQAGNVVFSEKDKKVKLSNVIISFAEESGVQGRVKSKEAIYDITSKIARIQGEVKYTSKTGSELTCALLSWNLDKDQIHVPGKFFVVHKNNILHGANLVTNSKLEYSSMQDIQGVIR